MEKTSTKQNRAARLLGWCGALGAALWLAGCAVTDVGRAPIHPS